MKPKYLIVLWIVLLTLPACSPPRAATVEAIPSPVPSSTAVAAPIASPSAAATLPPAAPASRILILSMDGLRPDAIALAPMPNLLALIQNSAHSLTAQTVYPSITLVSHSSMLTGLCPDKHGVDWNDYEPEKGYAKGFDLFDLAKAHGLQTAMYVGKEKMRHVTEPASTDIYELFDGRDVEIAEQIVADFPQDFGLLFIHLPTTDRMGHRYGWLSERQLSAIQQADQALGKILTALDARNLRAETLIIITADHGGHGLTHGSDRVEDMTIPWIAAGPGIQPKQLETQVQTIDTAATAAFAVGLPIPPEWDGVPVYEAFGFPVEKESVVCG